ncbi:hypothetical protein BRD00_13865 [Halobacteriales archaeon QS_8_69_26]|nr:MAG: hypothetical protein BRD00_13865 [Halobacteriales archaeon QS_8_69_26]
MSADASMVQQPTEDHPPTVELGVTNDHDRSVTLVPDSSDAMLYYLPPMEGETVDIYLVPEDLSSGVIPNARIDGCWRFDADSESEAASEVIQVRPSQITHELGPGERYAIRHEVYHNLGSGPCFPDGEYTTSKRLMFTEEPGKRAVAIEKEDAGPAFRLEYTLTAEADGTVSINVDGPDPA